MYKKTVSGIMLMLLLLGTLMLTFNIKPAKARTATVIVPDDYPTIQEAINHANEGDIILVRAGIYYEKLVIDKELLLLGEDKTTTVIDGNGSGTVLIVRANKVIVSGFTIRNGESGVDLIGASGCFVFEMIITNNLCGLYVSDNSSNNFIIKNMATQNDIGVLIIGDNNHILYNNIEKNDHVGIALEWASHNKVMGNNISYNGYLYLDFGFNSGIFIYDSFNNTFVHNNVIENKRQVSIDWWNATKGSTNTWNSTYPSGGNYWSNYDGTDLYSGPYQNETGSDGIGDIPYVINENNQDNYPLMNPWTPTSTVITATIDIDPNTLNLKSRGKWITAYIELPEGYNVSDIDVSSIMLNGTVPVDLSVPMAVGDYDNDSVLDLMVCFNRTDVINYILAQAISFGNVTLTISGSLWSGTPFMGSCIIAVSDLAGDVNCDGVVDIYDISGACLSYDSKEGESNWNPNANYAPPYNKIDIFDIVTIACHYGETYP